MTASRILELSTALEDECRRRGYPLRPGGAEDLLNDRLGAVAAQLGVSRSSALRTYFSGDDWVVAMADSIAEMMARSQAAQDGPPLVLPTTTAAQLVSALGVAAKYAANNAEHAPIDECSMVGDHAGDALTILGAALREGAQSGSQAAGMPVVHIDRKAAVLARGALAVFSERLHDGAWRDCWCGVDDLDHIDLDMLTEQVDTDLRLVEAILRS